VGLIRAFDRRIYPLESAVFSTPPSRDGTGALVGPPFHPKGRGDRIVVLVDNIRGESYFDLNNAYELAERREPACASGDARQPPRLHDRRGVDPDGVAEVRRTPSAGATSAPA
jgi:hypothetical protein